MKYRYYTLIMAWPDMNIPSYAPHELEQLLAEGWRPVRETPMGGTMVGGPNRDGIEFMFASLILLEKEAT